MSTSKLAPSLPHRVRPQQRGARLRFVVAVLICCGALALWPSVASAAPPAPSQPTATCGATVAGKCYVNGPFTLSSFSSGADHYGVCSSGDTTGWGGCSTVLTNNSGPSYTVSGANLPSDGFRRAYRFRACDASNDCTAWTENTPTYVYMDLTGPTAPGPTSTSCLFQSAGCWVKGNFTISVSPASDTGSGVGSYDICRSTDSTGGHAGCNVFMTTSGGTSFTVSGSNLPADGFRRAYYFRGNDLVGNNGTWNTPIYVRIDRYNPTVSANNASATWFASRTVTITAADATNGAAANSGLIDVRYRWNAAHNGTCTSGTATTSGAVLTVPEGDNHLYLCARDNTGRVGFWNGGPYRVDTTVPILGGLTVSSSKWNIDDGSVYAITSSATDTASGVRAIRNRINLQGSNVGNERGLFSWQSTGYEWSGDQVLCTGGGFGSKHPTVANPGTITLVSCSTSLSGSTRTVTFNVRPNETFGEFGPINDISLRASDNLSNWANWANRDVNFESVTNPPTVSANNASATWFKTRTTTITASAFPGSTLQSVRYRWNTAHNAGCTSGTATSNGATLTVPEGDNQLYLCATDSLGRIGQWSGGPYRVDATIPSLGALTISNNVWIIDDGSTYTITATVTDGLSGIYEIRTRTNIQGSNIGNERGLFSWRQDTYTWTGDQMPCTGGGFASKYTGAVTNPGTVTLVGCATSTSGSSRTVTFTVLPNATFGEFGPINDISLRSGDVVGNWTGWVLYDLNFSSQVALHPDFSLGIVPFSRSVPRLRTRDFTISVNPVDGFSNPVSLSVSGLPAGVTGSFSPATVSPGASSVLTVSAAIDAALTSATFTVTGTGGGKTRTKTASLTVTQNAPVVGSVAPMTIQRGGIRTLTINGSELMDATVQIGTDPYDPAAPPPTRTYPTVQSATVSSDAKRLTVTVDVTSASIDGFYNLSIQTPGGDEAAQFRVVGAAPVVDMFTPSEPIEGNVHVFTAVGENLQGANVVPLSGGIQVLDLDNSDPQSLNGLLYVAPGTPSSAVRISGPGGSVDLPIEPRIEIPLASLKTSPLDTGEGTAGPAPRILLQEPKVLFSAATAQQALSSLAAASKDEALRSQGDDLSICGTFSRRHRISFAAILLRLADENNNPLTQQILNSLLPGGKISIHNTTLAVTGFLEFEFGFRLCSSGASDLFVCVRGGIAIMVPGLGGQSYSFDICAGIGGSWVNIGAEGFISNFGWTSSDPCVQVRDLGGFENGIPVEGSPVGERLAEVEMVCCAAADLSVQIQGQALGGVFNVGGEVAQVVPSCLEPKIYEVEIRAFIPVNVAEGPPGLGCFTNLAQFRALVFRGDNRDFAADPPSSLGVPGFRVEQKVKVVPVDAECSVSGICGPNGEVTGSFLRTSGRSESYAENALANLPIGVLDGSDRDGVPNDCDLWNEDGYNVPDDDRLVVHRVDPDTVQIVANMATSDPLVAGAPNLDWQFNITINSDGTYAIGGIHDCYPAYEVYINNQRVWGYMPTNHSWQYLACCLTPLSLSATISESCTGSLADPLGCFLNRGGPACPF